MIDKKYAPVMVRIGIALVFLWFGINQILFPENFLGYLPQWVFSFPIPPESFLLVHGLIETLLGFLLLVGLFTRLSAIGLGIQLLFIIIELGYNDVAIRDIGLLIAIISIVINGDDNWCFDNKVKNRLLKKVIF